MNNPRNDVNRLNNLIDKFSNCIFPPSVERTKTKKTLTYEKPHKLKYK